MSSNSKKKIVLFVCVIVMTVVLASAFAFYYSVKNSLNKKIVKEDDNNNKQVVEVQEENIKFLAVGVDASKSLTDVIMYGIYDIKNNKMNILQIPRDSFVGNDYPTGKINAVYGNYSDKEKGIAELENVLKKQFKLDIDYHVIIGLDGFSNIIDSLGGVKMNVPLRIDYLPNKIIYKGEQVLNGEKSIWLVRYRKGYANADLGRINIQKQFLLALFDTVKSKGRLSAISAVVENFGEIKTDMPLTKAIALAGKAFYVPKDNISMFVIKGNGKYNGNSAVYELNGEDVAKILNENFRKVDEQIPLSELDIKTVGY